jgi:integrase
MSLYKQPSSKFWWFQIWTPEGTRIRRSTETDDRAKAEVVEKTFKMAIKREAPAQRLIDTLRALYGVEEQSMGVGQVWSVYLEWLKASGKELVKTTLDKRALAVRRFTDWATSAYPAALHVAAVDRAAATAFAAYLAEQGMKGKTRQNIIGDLSTVWEALKRARDGITNPWPLVRPEANDSERGHAFTREQELAVMKAANKHGHEWPLACLISRYTGLRYSSIGRLAWADVDLKRAVIDHTPNKTKRHGINVLVPLVEPLLSALKAARTADPEGQHVLPIHARVYPRTHASNGPGLFSKILEAAKVAGDGYTFHSWRHTFRTRLSEAGVSDDLAKRLGGWTEDATAARYDHAERVEELRAAVEKAK